MVPCDFSFLTISTKVHGSLSHRTHIFRVKTPPMLRASFSPLIILVQNVHNLVNIRAVRDESFLAVNLQLLLLSKCFLYILITSADREEIGNGLMIRQVLVFHQTQLPFLQSSLMDFF